MVGTKVKAREAGRNPNQRGSWAFGSIERFSAEKGHDQI